nr:MAG TPA: adenine specific DNA methyltransferase [Caudoviricetes sp.]
MGKISIQYVKIQDIIPYDKNPRINDDSVDKVAASIREFGFKVPIMLDSKNVIIAGHTRLKAAKKLKLKELPCVYADDLSDEQVKALRLADNKVGESSLWDEDLLSEELSGILNIDMDDFGFGDIMKTLLSGLESETLEDPDAEIEPPAKPVTQPGDIWQIGRHRLICGDSTQPETAVMLMDGETADLLITDPPYNVNYEGGAGKIKNDNMDDKNFRQFLKSAFSVADGAMKPGAVFYIWHADSEGYNFRNACFEIGWQIRQCLIWNKNAMVLGRQDYQWKHEPCLYGWKDGATHYWGSDRKQVTVLDFDKPARNADHPTMKPVDLIRYQIENSSKPGWVVLDIFAGSGSTMIAAEMSGRSSRLVELDPKFCDVIVRRYINVTGKQDVTLVRDGRETPLSQTGIM